MTEFFLTIVNMSISASWIVLAVLLLRLVLKKAPKWITVVLWGIVAVRLICPFSIESALSLIPSAETISPEIMMDATPEVHTGVPVFNNAVNPIISESFAPTPGASINPLQIWIPLAAIVWITGMTAMLIYTIISYWRVKRKIGTAVLLQDNIFQSENVVSPFVLGIIKPKIYLPFQISGQDMSHVIAHENAHIRRKDHWWKPLGFLLLSIHWFNPLMWLGYILLCRDIELACDEKVIKEMDTEQKADYSQALLTCSVNRRMIAACPLAFGEVSVKNRIKSVLNYKKPAFWIIIVAIVISLVVGVCFLTNPASNQLKNIEFLNLSTTADNTVRVLVSDGTGYKCVDANKELLTELVDIPISKKETSISRSEDRSKRHTIVLQSAQDARPSIYSHIPGVFIHFNSTFTSVWVDNGVKPTFSYRVLNPAKAKTIYNSIAQSPVVEEELPEDALILMDLEILKLNWPMYFDLPTAKGLEVYIWQTNENSYSCGLLPGRNSPYTEQELWDLEKNATALGVMQTIISYYISNGEVTKEEVTICPLVPVYSSRPMDYYETYQQELAELFWSGVPNADNPIIETTLSYANWSEGSTIYVGGLNRDKMYISSVQHLPIYKFDTLQELERFKEHYGQYHTMDRGYDEVPSFNEVTANYDESFFADNSLVLVYVGANNSTHRFGVQGVIFNDSTFCVNIKETTGAEAVDTAMAGWFITLAVPDEQIKNCTTFDASLQHAFEENIPADEENVTESVSQPTCMLVYAKTPPEEIEILMEKEEFIYTHNHYQLADGKWHSEGYEYAYRLEVTGRMNNAAKNTTYIVLSNSKDITFDQTWLAAGFSSNSEDYFDPKDAIIVGYRHFSGQVKDDPAETEPPVTTPDNSSHSSYKLIVAGRDITQGSNITSQNIIGIFKDMYLPFTAILKCYGAQVNWITDTVAEITCNGSKYILDLSDQTMVKEGSNGNYIIPAPGSTLYTKAAAKELYIDSLNLRCVLRFIGTNVRIEIDHQNKTVTIQ